VNTFAALAAVLVLAAAFGVLLAVLRLATWPLRRLLR
jgi:hypothetical protein